MKNKKICEKCQRKIDDSEDYFEVRTYSNKELIKKGWLHKKCNEFMNQQNAAMIKTVTELGSYIHPIMKELGITPPKNFEIVNPE